MAAFVSTVDAVNGAVETRRESAGQNAGLSGDRRTDCRIGINPGGVVVQNGVIRGDRVDGTAVTHSLTVGITAHIVLA